MSTTSSTLRGFQRRHLRKLAHGKKPVVFVGDGGISDAVMGALDAALRDHELVKVKLHEPESKKATALELARRADAELCGLVGHMVILYRRNEEAPKIELPTRED